MFEIQRKNQHSVPQIQSKITPLNHGIAIRFCCIFLYFNALFWQDTIFER
ncbi:hypothetical protein EZS27_031394 [termite gut metagenome]|uniref:Uncharacterized protein n=1 Tax=termite gut metagenome TaxID=433724 RepID=A0A5J4QD22_9ZZZZ